MILAAIAIVWALSALVFLFAGSVWGAVNAIGLLKRRAWARLSTLAYAVLGIASCIGIPYAAYSLWSLTRSSVKRLLAE
jgi:hypothetical protein